MLVVAVLRKTPIIYLWNATFLWAFGYWLRNRWVFNRYTFYICPKNTDHLFVECNIFESIWLLVIQLVYISHLSDHMYFNALGGGCPKKYVIIFILFGLLVFGNERKK